MCSIDGRLAVLPDNPQKWVLVEEGVHVVDDYGNEITPAPVNPTDFVTVDYEVIAGDKAFNEFVLSKCPQKPKKLKKEKVGE